MFAFTCNDIVRLRYAALAANAAFNAYGIAAQLWPVLASHFVLVPINLWRLGQTLLRARRPGSPTPVSSRAAAIATQPD